jgi:hypothetical protein
MGVKTPPFRETKPVRGYCGQRYSHESAYFNPSCAVAKVRSKVTIGGESMMGRRQQEDTRVARQLLGHFIDGDYKEIINIEYRYAFNSNFALYTRIHGHEYQITDHKFFGALAELLDQLPITSAIMIPHQIIVLHNGSEEIARLEEWLYPFEEPTSTVVYQLKLFVSDGFVETPRYTDFGYAVTDFGSAAEYLRKLLGDETRPEICYYCKYLVEYNDFGGTDYRHDQLYCFRDSPETLNELMKVYPTLKGLESLLAQGTPDMDALHSCAAFTYRETPRP